MRCGHFRRFSLGLLLVHVPKVNLRKHPYKEYIEIARLHPRVESAQFNDDVQDATEAVLAYWSPEVVVYAVLHPAATRGAALDACHALCALLRARQHHLFLPA